MRGEALAVSTEAPEPRRGFEPSWLAGLVGGLAAALAHFAWVAHAPYLDELWLARALSALGYWLPVGVLFHACQVATTGKRWAVRLAWHLVCLAMTGLAADLMLRWGMEVGLVGPTSAWGSLVEVSDSLLTASTFDALLLYGPLAAPFAASLTRSSPDRRLASPSAAAAVALLAAVAAILAAPLFDVPFSSRANLGFVTHQALVPMVLVFTSLAWESCLGSSPGSPGRASQD
jgi:hypothetical protein